MLDLVFGRSRSNCQSASRRDFLKVGTLGFSGLTLPHLLAARSARSATGQPAKKTSVVWLWLGGGPTHVETFDPKMTAPVEYRSVTGEVQTNVPGITLGGTFPRMAEVADKLALVRSFSHKNSGHSGGTHWVMTGYDHRAADSGSLSNRPSMGSILSRVRGTNDPTSGVPSYVRLNGIYADGPAFLGAAYSPFDPNGQARRNMNVTIKPNRLDDRRSLLKSLDRINRAADNSGLMDGLSGFEKQAYQLMLGSATTAFDIKKEDPKTRQQYGKGLGEKMLLARRLCEAGCGFVTIHYGGWDMHGNIKTALERRSPQMDQAVSAFIEDVHERGLSENILLVITGEFGRTPRVNRSAGRDHWAPLSALAMAGGGLQMGQIIGESSSKVDVPKSKPITPQDLMATIFHVLGIKKDIWFTNNAGRPTFMIEDGHAISELV